MGLDGANTDIWPLCAPSFTHLDVCTNTNKQLKRQALMYACIETCKYTFKVGYLRFDLCSTVNDRIDSWAPNSFTCCYFSHSISSLIFFPHRFPMLDACVCMCMCAHPTGEYVCHSVLLQGREEEACLFQGTPPELMFHTCAQCSTLYRASQVHCINCGRNHFIVGVLLHLFSGMHSITQYSHLNCF